MAWSWSLSIEEQFYVVFPLLILLLPKNKPSIVFWAVFIWIIFGIFWLFGLLEYHNGSIFEHGQMAQKNYGNYIYASTIYRSTAIASGILAAILTISLTNKPSLITENRVYLYQAFMGLTFMMAFICIFLGTTVLAEIDNLALNAIFHLVVAISTSTMILYLNFKKMPFLSSLLESKALVPIARLSYSLYLLHPVAYVLSAEYFASHLIKTTDMNVVILVGSAILISFIIATLMHLYVELPFMSLRHRLSKEK